MRLNLGSGHLPVKGFLNVDMHTEEADIQGDLRFMDFRDVEAVRMSHVLEHLPWQETVTVLERIRSWMKPGGEITVEVPDMKTIMREGSMSPHAEWVIYVYGCQDNDGEYHKAGFTEEMLRTVLMRAGYTRISTKTFRSTVEGRIGMPCLEAVAVA